MKHKHLSYMSAFAALLLATSCSNDVPYDYEGESSYNNELKDVTFTITAESLGIASRAGDDPSANFPNEGLGHKQRLSRGSKIDMLVYAVYMHDTEASGDLEYKLLTQYGKGYIDIDGKPTEKFDNQPAYVAPASREGQTIVDVSGVFNREDGTYGGYSLTLRLMRNQTYTIAFWAQSSETDAYNTTDLRNITVNYDGYNNNDEGRDAFCKSENLSVGNNSPVRTVILGRPFAQINVATTGADYKNLFEGRYVYKNMAYKYSRMTLDGVATKFNLVTDEVSGDNLTKVTFDWALMPAFMKLVEEDTFDADQDTSNMTPEELNEYKKNMIERDEEEFLYVKLKSGSSYLDYKTDWPTYQDGEFLTETFKYLSMCYVLVPSDKKYNSSDDDPDYVTSVLKEVTFEFAENEDGKNTNEYRSYQSLPNVPVKRNWRTNILGGLGEGEGVSSIFNVNDLYFIQNSEFVGDKEPQIHEKTE